jgi:hypothetical protein
MAQQQPQQQPQQQQQRDAGNRPVKQEAHVVTYERHLLDLGEGGKVPYVLCDS